MLMTSIALAVLALPAAGPVPPPTGKYVVERDTTEVSVLSWEGRCGKRPETSDTRKVGHALSLAHTVGGWRLLDGAKPLFGTDICNGENRTLRPVVQEPRGEEWFLACEPTRLVRGEEHVETRLFRANLGRVEVDHRRELRFRKGRDLCHAILQRRLRIRPHVEINDPIAARIAAEAEARAEREAATPPDAAAPDAPAPPPARTGPGFTAVELEASLESQLIQDRARREIAEVKIAHENRMSEDFKLVSRVYKLDAKPLDASGKRPLASGETTSVFDDVLESGTHVLEVELVYQAFDGGTPVKLTVRDALFFDVTTGDALDLKVVGLENEGMFLPVKKRPKVRFLKNGKPMIAR